MSDGYIGEADVAVLQELQAKLREALGARREEHERIMLDSWEYELRTDQDEPAFDLDSMTREEVSDLFDKIYQRKAEGDGSTPWNQRLTELSSEDYEAIDYQEGWEYGFGAAQEILSEMLGELES